MYNNCQWPPPRLSLLNTPPPLPKNIAKKFSGTYYTFVSYRCIGCDGQTRANDPIAPDHRTDAHNGCCNPGRCVTDCNSSSLTIYHARHSYSLLPMVSLVSLQREIPPPASKKKYQEVYRRRPTRMPLRVRIFFLSPTGLDLPQVATSIWGGKYSPFFFFFFFAKSNTGRGKFIQFSFLFGTRGLSEGKKF